MSRDNNEIDVIELIRTLWRFKWGIVLITALFAGASVYVALTAKPVFRAEVLTANVKTPPLSGASALASQLGGLGALGGLNVFQGGPGQEALAVLQSRRLTEAFIEKHGILSELATDSGEEPTLWQAVKRFQDTILKINDQPTEGTTTVAIEWTDPDVAARWANDYVALANDLLRMRALEQSENNIQYLREQAEQTEVVELERAIYNLIESEIQKLMVANARAEYAFSVVDPAVPPELRSRPKRKLIVISGVALGGAVAVLLVLLWNMISRVRRVATS